MSERKQDTQRPRLHLQVPNEARKVLLHSCCAPCSSAIIECLLDNDIQPTIFYYNPNIYPLEEYEIRKNENIRYVHSLGLTFIDGDYHHDRWRESVRGLEHEPERGGRCQQCFNIRMEESARMALEQGLSVFTTTLASSRWKDLSQIAQAGKRAERMFPGAVFWEQNWRKGGLTNRRAEIIRQFDFYNQQYCGCEFSFREIEP